MIFRYLIGLSLGAVVTVGLFWVMQWLIHTDETGVTDPPSGRIVDECGCGLPRFETASGERCLNSECRQPARSDPQSRLPSESTDSNSESTAD